MTHSKFFAFDAAPGLVKRAVAQAALTSTGYVGTQWDQGAAALTDAICVVNVESIVTAGATGETYVFRIVGSNVADRSDGETLAVAELGSGTTLTVETRSTIATDRAVIRFRTEKNETKFRYVDLHMTVAGTAPSIAFNAHISKEIG